MMHCPHESGYENYCDDCKLIILWARHNPPGCMTVVFTLLMVGVLASVFGALILAPNMDRGTQENIWNCTECYEETGKISCYFYPETLEQYLATKEMVSDEESHPTP